MNNTYIGKKIRKDRNISRTALAKLSGVPMRTIQNWEDGSRVARDVHQLKKVSDVLNVSIEELFEWE